MRDDRDAFERLRAGNASAFETLFREYYARLVTFATHLVGTTGVAEEVVQDVFLTFWRHRERIELLHGNLSAYLFSAVRNASLAHVRHTYVEDRWRTRVEQGEALTFTRHPEQADAAARFNEVVAAVQRAIDELPPRCRQAFLLRRQHGLSYAEIAQVMSISPKTVEVQIGAALRTLRARLAHFYE